MRKISDAGEVGRELSKLLAYTQRGRPSRARIASELERLSSRLGGRTVKAMLDQGPVGRVLLERWNQLHDIEYDLQQTVREYADAEHFLDGPAERDAKEMIKKIEAAVKELEGISKGTFQKLVDAEEAFVKKHGEPSAYADSQRRQNFPR